MTVQNFGIAAAGKTWHCTTFTSTATWTKNPNAADLVLVDQVGGGQAGTSGSAGAGASGGNSGQRVVAIVNVNGVSSLTVTIGAGGVTTQQHGGDTTFGTLLRAFGSARATPDIASYGGAGGPFTFLHIDNVLPGQTANNGGVPGKYHPGCAIGPVPVGGTTNTYTGGGAGAGTFYGQGGDGGDGSASVGENGSPGTGYGSGGGGGGGGPTPGTCGTGRPGICKVWEYW